MYINGVRDPYGLDRDRDGKACETLPSGAWWLAIPTLLGFIVIGRIRDSKEYGGSVALEDSIKRLALPGIVTAVLSLWLMLALPFLAWAHLWRERRQANGSLLFSSAPGHDAKAVRWALTGLPYVAYVVLILGLARPVALNQTVERKAEGIDIVITLDLSGSMKAEDLRPNRFEAAKTVASEFIANRESDRIGLVVFARQSFTLVPPTLDYTLLRQALADLKLDQIQDGTAIGMGIATSVNRLKTSNAVSKVIIILTDGENNSGEIDPLTAADLAAQYGIRVYTIGASTEGTAPYPIDDPIRSKSTLTNPCSPPSRKRPVASISEPATPMRCAPSTMKSMLWNAPMSKNRSLWTVWTCIGCSLRPRSLSFCSTSGRNATSIACYGFRDDPGGGPRFDSL